MDERRRRAIDQKSLLQSSCPTASFGLVWNFVDDKNYYAASFSRIVENNYDEVARNQYFKLVIKKVSNGECSVLSEKEIKSGVTPDPYEYNAFRIEYDGQTLSVSVGNVTLGTVFFLKDGIAGHVSNRIFCRGRMLVESQKNLL